MPKYSKIPRVSITSGMSCRPAFLAPLFPTVVVDDNIIPPPSPSKYDMGYRVLILNEMMNVKFDAFFSIDSRSWCHTFDAFYDDMLAAIQNSGHVIPDNIFLLAGYNLDWNATPTKAFYDFISTAGAADILDDWMNNDDRGSSVANDPASGLPYMHPAVYILVTRFGRYKYSGAEFLEGQAVWSETARQKVTVSVPIY